MRRFKRHKTAEGDTLPSRCQEEEKGVWEISLVGARKIVSDGDTKAILPQLPHTRLGKDLWGCRGSLRLLPLWGL